MTEQLSLHFMLKSIVIKIMEKKYYQMIQLGPETSFIAWASLR